MGENYVVLCLAQSFKSGARPLLVMLRKFCPRCAKEIDELFGGLCRECYLETVKFVEVPQSISLLVCRCGRSNEKKKWVQNVSVEEMIERIVTLNVKKDRKTMIKVEYEPFVLNGKTRVPVTICCERVVDGNVIVKHAMTELVLVPRTCDVCSRVSGGYYEAIIQIRGVKYKQEQLLGLVERIVNRYKDTDKFSFITQVQNSKAGIDVYLGSSKIAGKIEQESKRIYKVTSKITHSVCGVKDGRELNRITILLRISD